MHLDISAVKVEKLTEQENSNVENLTSVRERVQKARYKQEERITGLTNFPELLPTLNIQPNHIAEALQYRPKLDSIY